MRLTRVTVEGYRSINESMTLYLDRIVTIILGANDHGKSNLLEALTHLNLDNGFEPGKDINWDKAKSPDSYPRLVFELSLDDEERQALLNRELESRSDVAGGGTEESDEANSFLLEQSDDGQDDTESAIAHRSVVGLRSEGGDEANGVAESQEVARGEDDDGNDPSASDDAGIQGEAGDVPAVSREQVDGIGNENDESSEIVSEDSVKPSVDVADDLVSKTTVPREKIGLSDMPHSLTLSRIGIHGQLTVTRVQQLSKDTTRAFLNEMMPRVELFQPFDSIQDSVSWAELNEEENEFMRGIFYYAGIDARDCEPLFVQDDVTDMELDMASKRLNEALRSNWSQGKELEFRLAHRSGRIELEIRDPSVKVRFVRASQRSSGFTHFFTLKTVLHARQREYPASSYIYLFDEPGVYLHPLGQRDLIQVLELIGRDNQVAYSTHSIFMINRNYPTRHVLVTKDLNGTKPDAKPFVSRWGRALQALGVSLGGSTLFADHVLLCEGDSDAILIPPVLQSLVARGVADIDINALAVVAFGDARTAIALIRLFGEAATRPELSLLVDGDGGGAGILKALKPVLDKEGIPGKSLADKTTIEDYVPDIGGLYIPAAARYSCKVANYYGLDTDEEDIGRQLTISFQAQFEAGKLTHGIAAWAVDTCQKLTGLVGAPSKVGIAREYVSLLEERDPRTFAKTIMGRADTLRAKLESMLNLPRIAEVSTNIVDDNTE